MEFPLNFPPVTNSSGDVAESLYGRKPVVAGLYVAVLGVATVVGSLGNLVIIVRLTFKQIGRRPHRAGSSRNDAGVAFIANLALSDLIVTGVINPLAIAGLYLVLSV